jgi:hypothetical protein
MIAQEAISANNNKKIIIKISMNDFKALTEYQSNII